MRWRLPVPGPVEADRTPIGSASRTTARSPGRTARGSAGCRILLWSVSFTVRPSLKARTPVAGSRLATTPLTVTGGCPGIGFRPAGVDGAVAGAVTTGGAVVTEVDDDGVSLT